MFDAWRFGWSIEDAMAGHINMPWDSGTLARTYTRTV